MIERRSESGFTLIELLIVVVIIGILAAIAIPKYSEVRKRGQMAAVQSDLRNLSIAQERHHMENFTYTNVIGDLEFNQSSGVIITINEATETGWAATGAHAGDPSIACGLFVGNAAPAGGAPATTAEAVACNL